MGTEVSPEGTRRPAEPELAPGVSHRSLLLPPRTGSLGNSALKAETLSAGVPAAKRVKALVCLMSFSSSLCAFVGFVSFWFCHGLPFGSIRLSSSQENLWLQWRGYIISSGSGKSSLLPLPPHTWAVFSLDSALSCGGPGTQIDIQGRNLAAFNQVYIYACGLWSSKSLPEYTSDKSLHGPIRGHY